jgi:hypothetical protein
MKLAALTASLVAVLTVTATGGAATSGLRVIATARSSGDFASAAASGYARNVHAVYLRGTGRNLAHGFGTIACTHGGSLGTKATTMARMVSGKLYRLRLPFPGDCQVTASLTGAGPIKIQILVS